MPLPEPKPFRPVDDNAKTILEELEACDEWATTSDLKKTLNPLIGGTPRSLREISRQHRVEHGKVMRFFK